MANYNLRSLIATLILTAISTFAQMPGFPPMTGEKIDGSAALDRALKASSLTFEGKPFHAVMEIGTAGAPYSGSIELWWVSGTKYHLLIKSPAFSRTMTINGDKVFEKNEGDYYPRWLENFVSALIDPVPMAKNFRIPRSAVMIGDQVTQSCLRRDDRPRGNHRSTDMGTSMLQWFRTTPIISC